MTEERYKELVAKCNAARPLYMQGQDTGMSDEVYDSYMNEIYTYEKTHTPAPDSPTQSVNPDDLGDVKHPIPMLSLRDVFSVEDAVAFFKQHFRKEGDVSFSLEDKMDGLSVQLIYRYGELVSAATRGNGYEGIECLEAAKHIPDIPETIDHFSELIVRGEVFMTEDNFKKYCERFGKQANPRNTAVGIFKRKNEKERATYLSFRAFNLDNAMALSDGATLLAHHVQDLKFLNRLGIPTVRSIFIGDEATLTEAIAATARNRETMGYPIDGMVLKINQVGLRQELGDNGVIPNWAVAYKFPAKEQETRLLSIEFQVGSSGKLTPVAILEPVLVAGSTIGRCTLHNRKRIEDLGIQIGDMVVVYKSGDIIPAIKSCRHTPESKPVEFPKVCPACGQPLENDVCVSLECPEKLKARLVAWVSKSLANFKGVSDSMIQFLFSRNIVKTPADFYTQVKPIHIMAIPHSGKSKVNAFMLGVQNSKKEMEFPRIVVGLGIDGLSYAGSKAIDDYLESKSTEPQSRAEKLQAFTELTEDELVRILGNVKGRSSYQQLHETDFYLNMIQQFKEIFK